MPTMEYVAAFKINHQAGTICPVCLAGSGKGLVFVTFYRANLSGRRRIETCFLCAGHVLAGDCLYTMARQVYEQRCKE